MTAHRDMDTSERGGAGAWITVAALFAAYALSFVDRQLLSLLVEPLKADLRVGDTEIGLLQGPAFGLFYSALGLPLGWLADRTHRIRLIAAGVLLWSLMTVGCGFCRTFGELFAARLGVGVGEAALVPAAVSVIADRFGSERRALPMSVFTAGLSLGAGLALYAGGALIHLAGVIIHAPAAPLASALLSDRRPWQLVFMMAGVLGAPTALLVLLLREPARAATDAGASAGKEGPIVHIFAGRRLFAPFLAGVALLYLYSNAVSAWVPSLLISGYGWSAPRAGLSLGPLVMSSAIAGNLASGLLAGALARRGRPDATLLTMLLGAGLMLPTGLLLGAASTAPLTLTCVVLAYSSIALCFGVATASVVAVTPTAHRGFAVSLYLLTGNLVGTVLGPPSVGFALDRVFHDPGRVGWAIALVAVAAVAPGFLLMRLSARSFRAAAEAQGFRVAR